MACPYQQCKQPCLPPPICGKGGVKQCDVCPPACPCQSVCAVPSVKVVGDPCAPICIPPCAPKCAVDNICVQSCPPSGQSICVQPQGVCPCDSKCPDPCCKQGSC